MVWNKSAESSLKRIYQYIKEDSPQSAEKVRDEIFAIARQLADHPEKYALDKFKEQNQGDHRAFEKHSCRVAYRVTEKQIRILRVRHVKQEPKIY